MTRTRAPSRCAAAPSAAWRRCGSNRKRPRPNRESISAAFLDALPVPVWLRDKTLSLVWGNRTFLAATGAKDAESVAQATLDKTERDLAATARNQGVAYEARRFAVVGGQRRALAFSETPLDGAGVVGSAIDVTDVAAAEAKLQQHIDAHADTLDKLATAVAIFGRDQKLTFYNRAFARLWDLSETWLDSHPSDGDILDRLREGRKLPEQRDYQAWKRERLALYENPREYPSEELWHVPGGKTLRVVAQPHPFGGLTFLYEDVTEKLALESSYNTLIKVQSATLDTLQEGVAVFGPDGKLKLHNAAFLKIWELTPKDLAGEPHVRTIAAACAEKFGDEAVWERLIQSIVSGAPTRRDWGEIERNDRTILSLALSPLPDGATLVTFADVTDRFRIESALRERNDALEAADNLKSDFIKHVSYELRTPLNTILGFAEHLASGIPGELNRAQAGYVQDIVSGSHTLKDLINNILDLSLIESGALRLELERIDLHALLTGVAATAREWAAKVSLELKVDCAEDAGQFLGDERRIQQVVFNLLSNAFKYTPRGGTITLSRRDRRRGRADRGRRHRARPGAGSEGAGVRALRLQEPLRPARRRRAWAWRWSTASSSCMTAGWRSRAIPTEREEARWCAATSQGASTTKVRPETGDGAARRRRNSGKAENITLSFTTVRSSLSFNKRAAGF